MEQRETQIWTIDPGNFLPEEIRDAAELLQAGEIVAFPTETVYGLGANALDPDAVNRIFAAKGRPSDNPLIVHLADTTDISDYAEDISPTAFRLAEMFWPGPLTLIFRAKLHIPSVVTAGLDTVGLRVPDHPIARALIRATGHPLAAPSANVSGRPSPTRAEHVLADLKGRIAGLIDAGPVRVGLESTVLDLSGPQPVLLRPGGISLEQLTEALGEIEVAGQDRKIEVARSPGMKYRHYAPEGRLVLLEGDRDMQRNYIENRIQNAPNTRFAVLTSRKGWLPANAEVLFLGESDPEIAHRLFDHLRTCDALKIEEILVEGLHRTGLGRAIMNRLEKAAHQILQL